MRKNRSLASTLSTLGILALVAVVLSFWTIGRSSDQTALGTTDNKEVADSLGDQSSAGPAASDASGSGDSGGSAGGSGGAAGSRTGSGSGASAGAGAQGDCTKGVNAGATAVGVTAKSIKLGATIVTDGPGASFLGPVRFGMTTVLNRVNRGGGICGRRLELILRNDSWDGARGRQYIQNFVESEKVFALAVVPSSEGLYQADSYIREQKVPVVGTDGMLVHQYRNPWIWPVATPTISTMHIMAKEAYDRSKACAVCTQHFGIVFDAHYHFGVEGAYAFDQAIKRLTGKDIDGFDPALKSCKKAFCGIQPNQSSYTSEARTFYAACGMGDGAEVGAHCDFVAVLLEPDTALTWFSASYNSQPYLYDSGGFGSAQPLFSRRFAEDCGHPCAGMWVWTGYLPPIEQFAAQPAVAKYVSDVHAEQSSVDTTNQFVQGGYLGMELLVNALTRTGSNLTRENLRAVLDSTTFDSGLSVPLKWSAGNHFANTSARAFAIQYQQGFNGWRQKTDALVDPWVGQDDPTNK